MRTRTKFAHLASFQAIEFVDQPVPKTLDIFVCQTSEIKALFTKHSILLFAKNENTCRFNLILSLYAFPLGAPSTMTALWSTCFIPSFACVRGVVYNTEHGKKWKFKFGESTGKIEHTLMKGKWCIFIIGAWLGYTLYLCLYLCLCFLLFSLHSKKAGRNLKMISIFIHFLYFKVLGSLMVVQVV